MKNRFDIRMSVYSPTFGLHDTQGPGYYMGGLVHSLHVHPHSSVTFFEDENNEFCILGAMKTPIYRIVP